MNPSTIGGYFIENEIMQKKADITSGGFLVIEQLDGYHYCKEVRLV